VKQVTWATGLTAEGRPLRVPDMEPSLEGRRVCPSLEGASNWYSTSFNPGTGLYYVQTNDKCGVFTKIPMEWAAGKGYMGGSFTQAPNEPAQRVLRAIDIQTGKIVWEIPQTGVAEGTKRDAGVLATAAGIVFYGDASGYFVAVDERDGKTLWRVPLNATIKTSPMTFAVGGQQFIALAVGSTIVCFGL